MVTGKLVMVTAKVAPVLTDRDWVEIYYALESKTLQVDDDREWEGHLRNIMTSIQNWCEEQEITL